MSLAFGTAIFLFTLMAAYKGTGWQLGDVVVYRLKNLLGVFVAAVLYFVAVYHFTNLYSAAHHDVERFILMEGGRYTAAFWLGQVLLGGLMPLILLYHPMLGKSRFWIGAAALLVIAGGFAQMYVIIIGGQAYPLVLFPGMEVSSPFFDGQVSGYAPSLPEVALGLGGVALAGLTTVLGVKLLRFMPSTLADVAIDPHHRVASETDTVALSNA
jgi:molybdopterin-containing oxidoreductase family membrane subunit